MSPVSFFNRSVPLAAALLCSAAFAQAPANDTCAGAVVITPGATGATVLTTPVDITSAASASEASFSCLSSTGRSIWYTITPTVTGNYRFETCSTVATGTTVSDTVLAVYEGSCPVPTQLSGACGDDECASQSRVTTFLVAGRQYWVQAAKWQSTAPAAGASNIQIATTFVQELQTVANDTCGPTVPSLQFNRVYAATTASPDAGFIAPALDDARLDGGVAACFAGIGHSTSIASGRDVSFRFQAPAAGSYSFRAHSNSTPNTVLYLTNSCLGGTPGIYGPAECVGAANRNSGAAEQITCLQMNASQEVYVWLDESTASASGASVPLEISACFREVEPNDTPAQASPLSCITTGGITDAGEVDFFALGAPPAGSRVFALVEAAAANAVDFDLRVTTATSVLEYDDANASSFFGDSSALVAGTPLNGAPSYLRVNYFSSTTRAEPYLLYSKVETGTPTVEVEPNNSMVDATSGAMYFEGSIQDGGADVDFFKFTANEGDVIFAALDAVPDRRDAGTTAAFNFSLALVDATGTTLLVSDDGTTAINLATNYDAGLAHNGPAVPGDALAYRARTTGTYGIRVGKTLGLTNTAYGLSISVGCTNVGPTLASFTPTAGSPSGGELITLTGTNFSEQTVVKFGANVARVVSISPTQLVVNAPASALGGDVAVTVTNGIGLTATAPNSYTYEDPAGIPPTLTSVAPSSGPAVGGTTVTLTGSVFRADAGVFFDVAGVTVAATSVTRSSTTRLIAVTPAHSEGPAVVTVINNDGLSTQLDGGYTFLGAPTISAITPSTGLTTGAQTITITGTNLRAGTTVRIGGTLATGVTPAADGLSLTAITPSRTTSGAVDVLLRTTDGQEVTSTNGFTYVYPAPTIASVAPASGFASGNTLITITGTAFLASPTVTVGGVAATSVTRVSATSITARTPAGTPGPQPVVVTNSDAQSSTSTVNFTYVAAPAVTAISPSNGSALGGTRITITGTDFAPGARVSIGGVPAFAVAVSSSTSLAATTNSGAAGTYDVTVTNPDTQASTLMGAFTLDSAPVVTSLSPIGGSTAGGTVVTISGSGFRQGATVLFGASPATAVTIVSDTELTATTDAHDIGVVSVTVRNQDNQSGELARSFRFVDPPSLTAIAPTSGDVAGGTVVRLTGAGFSAAATVTFGGTTSSQVTFISATELDAVAPAHALGAVDVVITVDGADATLAGAFTYTRGAPTVSAAAPSNGSIEGGTLVTITGGGFVDGATVTFGGTAATGVVVASADLLRAIAPAHAAGAVDIVVTNDDAQVGTLAGGFTYTTGAGGPDNSITDGGSGAVGTDPTDTSTPGGVSCGCTSFDGSMFGFAGLGLVALLSRRRRRS